MKRNFLRNLHFHVLQARKISMKFQKKMGLDNIVSLAASPIVVRKRVSDSPLVRKKVKLIKLLFIK